MLFILARPDEKWSTLNILLPDYLDDKSLKFWFIEFIPCIEEGVRRNTNKIHLAENPPGQKIVDDQIVFEKIVDDQIVFEKILDDQIVFEKILDDQIGFWKGTSVVCSSPRPLAIVLRMVIASESWSTKVVFVHSSLMSRTIKSHDSPNTENSN